MEALWINFQSLVLVPMLTPVFLRQFIFFHVLISFLKILIFIRLCAKSIYYRRKCEKEKSIIGQEIRMYDDNANWRVFFNLLDAFYEKNTVKIDIAGTVESISKIDREILYKCYNTFYHPSNMVIIVVGDVEPEKVFEMVEKNIIKGKKDIKIQRIFPEEPVAINKPYIEQKLAVSMPLFQMGFKDINFETKGIKCLNREIAVKILLEIILGRSSSLYTELYNEGLINNTFDFDYSIEEKLCFFFFWRRIKDPLW